MESGIVFDILKILLVLYVMYLVLRFVVNTSVELISNHWLEVLILVFGCTLALYLGGFWPFIAAVIASIFVSIYPRLKDEKARRLEKELEKHRAELINRAEAGPEIITINIAHDFLEGLSVQQDEDEGIRLLLRVAESGSVEAQREIIEMFSKGRGTPDKYSDAVRRFRLNAVDWPPEELESLAQAFDYGRHNVPKDEYEAKRWYRLAREVFRERAESGEAEATEWLAKYLYLGRGGKEDDVEALKWALVAARSGRKDSQKLAGELYCTSETVPRNYAEAVFWFRRASDQGEQVSKAYLVVLHDAGLGNPENYKKEAEIYRQELEAQLKRGHSSNYWWYTLWRGYEGVWFGDTDHEKAMHWLQLASDAGEAFASEKLGDRYSEGSGVPKDLQVALEFYRKSVEQGNSKATGKIMEMEDNLIKNAAFRSVRLEQ